MVEKFSYGEWLSVETHTAGSYLIVDMSTNRYLPTVSPNRDPVSHWNGVESSGFHWKWCSLVKFYCELTVHTVSDGQNLQQSDS